MKKVLHILATTVFKFFTPNIWDQRHILVIHPPRRCPYTNTSSCLYNQEEERK